MVSFLDSFLDVIDGDFRAEQVGVVIVRRSHDHIVVHLGQVVKMGDRGMRLIGGHGTAELRDELKVASCLSGDFFFAGLVPCNRFDPSWLPVAV